VTSKDTHISTVYWYYLRNI